MKFQNPNFKNNLNLRMDRHTHGQAETNILPTFSVCQELRHPPTSKVAKIDTNYMYNE